MGFREFKAIFFNSTNTNGTELDNVFDIRVIRTLNAKSNSAEIILNNYAQSSVLSGESIYKPNDTIKIFAADGNVDTANVSHLLGTYVIINIEIQPDPRYIKLICGDKTFEMLSRVVAETWTAETPIAIIEKLVQRINQDGTNPVLITTHITQTKSDNTAFGTIDYASAYKSGYDIISELSQPGYTGDNKPYMFRFDENNEFWWQYMTETPAPLVYEYGVNVRDFKVTKTQGDTIAMLIFDAGTDLNNISYIGFTYNPNSESIKGHLKFQPMTNIGPEYRRQLKSINSLPDTSSASILTIMNNTQFQTELDRRAKASADTIINAVGTGLWQSTFLLSGVKITPGDYHTVKAVESGFPPTNLRVERVNHTMNKNGWSTKLTLKEDPSKQ